MFARPKTTATISRGLTAPRCYTRGFRGGTELIYYGSKNLADSFRTVRKNTLTIANEIPEDQYGFRAAPGTMSVAELLAHLAVSPMWQIEAHTKKIAHLDFAYFASRTQLAQIEEN